MVARITKYFQKNLLTADLLNRTAAREAKCEKSGGHRVAELDEVHLLEAIGWLIKAQDAMPYGGLSRGYTFGWNPHFPKKGWQPAHPKLTGEAIPTLFDCAAAMGRKDLRRRAIALANWLIKIQMLSGALRGGAMGEPPSPEILNTAQAIIGWTRAFQETGTERYIQAARRASDFLLLAQEPDDLRRKALSRFAGEDGVTYSSKVGWALIEVGIALEEYRYCAAGEKNVIHSIQQQQPNGWFRDNCLDDLDHLLLYTIGRGVEGILRAALILDNDKYFLAAKKTADALLERIRVDGSLSGRFASDWSEKTSWSCLVGNAQMAGIWLYLYQATRVTTYLNAAQRVIFFLKRTQNRTTSHPGLRGGIKGSYPCDGEFGRYQILSSATKLFIDALLLLSKVCPQKNLSRPSQPHLLREESPIAGHLRLSSDLCCP